MNAKIIDDKLEELIIPLDGPFFFSWLALILRLKCLARFTVVQQLVNALAD